MASRSELLREENEAWRSLTRRLARLSDEDWLRPGVNGDWTIKDLVAHIAAWHAEAECILEGINETGEIGTWMATDEFNALAYQRCKDMTLADVRSMAASARHRYREEAAKLPDEVNDEVARVVSGSGHVHYGEHDSDIDAFLEAIGS